ncbi:MAG: hypothetical protein KGL39_13255 [Patescibacteria group bacterium]|nr:hypothetical protein [Patescibacteria group bacterium]
MKQKSKILLLLVALGAICLTPAAKAQGTVLSVTTNANGTLTIVIQNPSGGLTTVSNAPTTQGNFISNLGNWIVSRKFSGYTWPTNDTDLEVGANYASQQAWDNYVSVTKNLGSFYVGAQMDNAGVAGTVEQLGGRAGYTLSNVGDLRIKAGAYGGYKLHTDSLSQKGAVFQPEFGAEKIMTGPTVSSPNTATTAISAWLYWPFSLHGVPASTPGFRVGAIVPF